MLLVENLSRATCNPLKAIVSCSPDKCLYQHSRPHPDPGHPAFGVATRRKDTLTGTNCNGSSITAPSRDSFPGLPRTSEQREREEKAGREAWSELSRVQLQGRRQVDTSDSVAKKIKATSTKIMVAFLTAKIFDCEFCQHYCT